MGVGFRLSRRSHLLNFIQSEKMLLKAVLLCHLLLTPLVFSFNIPSQFKDYGTEIEARQFSDEPQLLQLPQLLQQGRETRRRTKTIRERRPTEMVRSLIQGLMTRP